MAMVLYSLVRFVKPKRVLEVGAGYTTLFILQALRDNAEEVKGIRAAGDFHGLEDWLVEGSLDGDASPMLHCVDNQEHEVLRCSLLTVYNYTIYKQSCCSMSAAHSWLTIHCCRFSWNTGGWTGSVGLQSSSGLPDS